MSAGLDYPVVSTGNVYTTIDTYYASPSASGQTIPPSQTALPNGAYNYPGQAYLLPISTFGLQGQNGQGAPPVVRYVRYNSTANPAVVAAPAPVYWKDETFTVVTGVFSEGLTGTANSLAGWLLPNTTAISGLTAAILNGNWCFIAVSGFVPGATSVATTAAGDTLIGAAGNFTVGRIAAAAAITSQSFASALTAVAAGVSDILIRCDWTY